MGNPVAQYQNKPKFLLKSPHPKLDRDEIMGPLQGKTWERPSSVPLCTLDFSFSSDPKHGAADRQEQRRRQEDLRERS